MTPNTEYIPTCWYYTRSLPQIPWTSHKDWICGLWLTVNFVCGPPHEGFPAVLMSAVTGCKLAKLGWNNTEMPEHFLPLSPPAGGVLSSGSGRAGGWAGGCQTCGTHISVTAWWIFSIRSSVELSRPLVVHCHGHLPICPIWACPWAKNLSNLPQIGSRLCGSHISETARWMCAI